MKTQWYKDAVIYQIYPRSFQDSNGDGIGDLKGITARLDYLASLGVNAVWLSPCYRSPNDDNGYDISDYRDIMTEFGTLDDWKEMIDGMHKRGIRLIMDLVVNHTSDEHFWFRESRKSKENPYRDYYIWRKGRGKDGKKPPNNWTNRFGGKAWEYDEATGEWYLHLFTKKQPDLNWDNPKVREEVADLVRYWLDLGVDGFRCDVITYISKREGLPDGKWNPVQCGDEHFTHGPHIHEYLKELNRNVLSKYDCMTVGEAAGVTIEQGLLYTGEDRQELDMVFTFEHLSADTFGMIIPRKFSLVRFKSVFRRWQLGLKGKGWNSLYLENHDQPRSVSRYVKAEGALRVPAAKMLATSIHLLEGSPYVYEGEEIGMTNCKFAIDEYQDIMVTYVRKAFGIFEPLFRPIIAKIMGKLGRDHARTPMQWSDKKNAGFTDGTPWLKLNPNYKEINVEAQEKDPDSILNYYRKLIQFRKSSETVRHGTYAEHYEKSEKIWCYERNYNGETLLVVLNFTDKEVPFRVPSNLAWNKEELVLHNLLGEKPLKDMTLAPFESLVYRLR